MRTAENGRLPIATQTSKSQNQQSGIKNGGLFFLTYPNTNERLGTLFATTWTIWDFSVFKNPLGSIHLSVKNEIDFIIECLDIRRYVRYILADYFDNEAHLKDFFKFE